MRFLLVASSSGGHVMPLISFSKYLKDRGHEVIVLGIKNQIEEQLIPDITLLDIPKSFKKAMNITGISKLYKNQKRVKTLIKKSDAVICFGGFISAYVGLFVPKKKLYLHEQNVVLGDSILFLKYKCQKIFLSFPLIRNCKNTLLVGNPSQELIKKNNNCKKVIFVAGSLGSSTLFSKLKEIEAKIDFPLLLILGKNKGDIKFTNPNITIKQFVPLKEELKDASIVISRAGATTLAELLAAKVNIIAIPSPYVKHNHQYLNAMYLENLGCLTLIEEKSLTADLLLGAVKKYLNDPTYSYQEIINQGKIIQIDASQQIEKVIINDRNL